MVCEPDNTRNDGSTTWVAYAYIDHWLSVYRGLWCIRPSAQMHEIGHNLNLAHSGEGNDPYDDLSCMVSFHSSNSTILFVQDPHTYFDLSIDLLL